MHKLVYGIVNTKEALDKDNKDGIPPQTLGGLTEAILGLEPRS
jgi:hypothetical protein